MLKTHSFIVGLFLLLSSFASWGESYYCAGTGQVVIPGTTMEEAIQACGKPSKTEEIKSQEPVERQELIQWVYESKENKAPWDTSVPNELIISFYQEQVVNIEVNGKPVDGSLNCFQKGIIQKGDNPNQVAQICGQPDMTQRSRRTLMGPEKTTVLFTYQRQGGLAPVIFEFKQDKLTAIRYGG